MFKSVLIVCLLVENMSVIQCIHVTMQMFPFQTKLQLQLPKPTIGLVPVSDKFACVQQHAITIFKVDYASMQVSAVSKIQHSGLCYSKLVYIDPSCVLLVAMREVADAKDVVQTLFIRTIVDSAFNVVTEHVLHFDLLVH